MILSPVLTAIGTLTPSSLTLPGPTATTTPCSGFSFAVSGIMMPKCVLSCVVVALTTTLSHEGIIPIFEAFFFLVFVLFFFIFFLFLFFLFFIGKKKKKGAFP